MDTGSLLWHLSSEDVKPLAHLEYQDGIEVFDCAGELCSYTARRDELECFTGVLIVVGDNNGGGTW